MLPPETRAGAAIGCIEQQLAEPPPVFLTNSVALSVALVDDGQLDLAASVSSWPMHCAWLYGGQDVGGEAHAARARWSMRVVAVARARTSRAREDADPNLIVSLRTFMAVTISS